MITTPLLHIGVYELNGIPPCATPITWAQAVPASLQAGSGIMNFRRHTKRVSLDANSKLKTKRKASQGELLPFAREVVNVPVSAFENAARCAR